MARSSFSSLWRLVRTYGRPYRGRIAIGVITGILVGGSVFGILKSSIGLFIPFDPVRMAGLSAAADKPADDTPPDHGTAADKPADDTPPDARNAETHPPRGDKQDDRIERILRYARRFGFEPESPGAAMSARFMVAAALGILVFMLLRAGAIVLNHYCLRWVGARIVVDLRAALLESLHRQSLAFFGRNDVGRLISRCTYDTARIEGAIASSVADLTEAPFIIAGAVVFAADYARRNNLVGTTLMFAVLAPLLIGPVVLMGRLVKRYSRRALRRISVLVSRFEENLTCIRVIKAFNTEAHEQARFRRESESYFHSVARAIAVEVLTGPMLEVVSALTICLFLVVCYFRAIPLSNVFPMALAGFFIYKPMKQLAKINAVIQRTAAAAERVLELLDTETSLPLPANPVVLEGFRDRVSFEAVNFRYDPAGNPVLQDIRLDVPKGSVIAFVGETGSGKTTMINLLARFYDPTEGCIRIDGHDLRTLDIRALRRLIGVVTQETILFNDTIAHNIAYGTPDATLEEIVEAARKANAHDFIVAEPEGYERLVGDKGMLLSGGQRQRIAIARAILKNPPILILDEATSALDTATEQLVQEAINRVMADRTVFAIAHRLSTIRHASLICVLDRGRIVERGTHEELLAAGGRYRRLCDMQFP